MPRGRPGCGRVSPRRRGAVSVELADGAGLPVLSVHSLVMRPVTAEQLQAAVSAAVAAVAPVKGCWRWCGRR